MKFTLAPATPDDAATLARLHVEGWQAAYGGIVDQDYLDSLSIEQRTADWQRWMAEDHIPIIARDEAGNPAGFCDFGKLKTAPPGSSPIRPPYSAEIFGLYILPQYWRHGLGTMFLRDAAQRLKEKKHYSLCLWVLEKNERACAFYKKMGGERCGKKDIEIGSSKVKEICYGWRKTAPLLPSAA